jgi:hypothetical protein
MKIYIAMAELPDGNRMYERAYYSYEAAKQAAQAMVEDVNQNTDFNVIPVVEDLELIDE